MEAWAALGGLVFLVGGLIFAAGRWMAAMHATAKYTSGRIDDTCRALEHHVGLNQNDHKEFWAALAKTNDSVQQLAIRATEHEGRINSIEKRRS